MFINQHAFLVGINGIKKNQPNKSLHWIFTPLLSVKTCEFSRWLAIPMMDNAQKQKLRELAKELSRLEYVEIEKRIENFESDHLIELLNSRSRKVGDSAYSCLERRKDGENAIIDGALDNRFTHRDAKVRATNFLTFKGRTFDSAIQVYFHFLGDKNVEVAINALFGIVFSQNSKHIPSLKAIHNTLQSGSQFRIRLGEAIMALEEENPFLFSRYYSPDAAERLWNVKNASEKRLTANKPVEQPACK